MAGFNPFSRRFERTTIACGRNTLPHRERPTSTAARDASDALRLMPDRPTPPDVTALLQEWRAGNQAALEQLVPIIYEELRRVARGRLRLERPDHTLQPTALVHEAYLRLIGSRSVPSQSRAQLFAVAARLMREILVDHARRKAARKRGGTPTQLVFGDSTTPQTAIVDLLALDEALNELRALDPRLCQVVELKFFAGLNIDETAQSLQVSTATVERDWMVSKAWLHQRLSP
jgi:RNA polymerase sigma factor (TIGR02999 family)